MKKRSAKRIEKNRFIKLAQKRKHSKEMHKANKIKKQKGKNLLYQIFLTINRHFPNLYNSLREIEDCRRKSEYELIELLVACIAMFIFKEGSRNAFNNDRDSEQFEKNYRKIFKLRFPHMDTVNNVMQKLKEEKLENLKKDMLKFILAKKILHRFRFQKHWFVVAIDGTGVISSSKRHCKYCSTKTSKNGKVTYYHTVLEAKLVCSNGFSLSLETEWSDNSYNDNNKQDCEAKAFIRLSKKLKKNYPRLPICIVADGLYPNQTFFNICEKNNWNYIVTLKDGNLKTLWKEIESTFQRHNENKRSAICPKSGNNRISQNYRWVNGLCYKRFKLSWVECVETKINTKTEKKTETCFTHICSFSVSAGTVREISTTGRLRWKIENEGFNVQKNQGYNLEHRYSRNSMIAGKNYYQCMQIAHLINQLVALSKICKTMICGKITLKHLWKLLIGYLIYIEVNIKEMSEYFFETKQIRYI